MAKTDPRVTKRKVTSYNLVPFKDEEGRDAVMRQQVEDYVRPDFLDAYVARQQGKGWQYVEVSDEPDAGPGGYEGPTYIPEGLDHPEAGAFYPAEGDHPLAGLSLEQVRSLNQED